MGLGPIEEDNEARREKGQREPILRIRIPYKVPGYKVIGQSEVRDLLGYQKQQDILGCDDASCMAYPHEFTMSHSI